MRLLLSLTALMLATDVALAQTPTQLRAKSTGGIAIGGNVADSTLIVGLTANQTADLVASAGRNWQNLTSNQRRELAAIQKQLGVSEGALQAFFATLGERAVPANQLAAKLGEIARRYIQLQARLERDTTGSEDVRKLRQLAQTALAAGQLDNADALLGRITEIERVEIDSRLASLVEVETQRGELALTQLRYRDAAARFDAAAIYSLDTKSKLKLGERSADAYSRQSRTFNDLDAAKVAVSAFRALVEQTSRVDFPVDWADRQTMLGRALYYSAGISGDVKRFEDALKAHEAAISVYTKDKWPSEWANQQIEIGIVLTELGRAVPSPTSLEAALMAFESALSMLSKTQEPETWADTKLHMAWALLQKGQAQEQLSIIIEATKIFESIISGGKLGYFSLRSAKSGLAQCYLSTAMRGIHVPERRKSSVSQLESALRLFEEELGDGHPERYRDFKQSATFGRGKTLFLLGEAESGTARLEASVQAYEMGITKEANKSSIWAQAQYELGNALTELGARQGNSGRLDAAIKAYEAALTVRSRERDSTEWAMTQMHLGRALMLAGVLEPGTARLEAAVSAQQVALTALNQDQTPNLWAGAQNDLGNSLLSLGDRANSKTHLEGAVTAYKAALKVWTKDTDSVLASIGMGKALFKIGMLETGTERLEEAARVHEILLTERIRKFYPDMWAEAQINLGIILTSLHERTRDHHELEAAVEALNAALLELKYEDQPKKWALVQRELGDALHKLSIQGIETTSLEDATKAYEQALTYSTQARSPLDWAELTIKLGLAKVRIAERKRNTSGLDAIVEAVRGARDILVKNGNMPAVKLADRVLGDIARIKGNVGGAAG